MRVLALTNMYPPHHYGGYEQSCRDVMRRFARRGHEVGVLTTTIRGEGAPDPAAEREPGVRRDLTMYWEDHALLDPSLPRRFAIERANQLRLREALREARPDVVSAWNMGAMSLGLLTGVARAGIPIVFVVCDDWLVYAPHVDAWARLWLPPSRRPVARAVDALTGVPTLLPDLGQLGPFCFVSERTRRRAVAESRFSLPVSTVVYSGIDTDDFPPLAPGAPVEPRPWRGRLLYVGRIDRRKGIETVITALRRLPGTTLDVVGSGDLALLGELRSMVGELGLSERVRFSSMPRDQLAASYRRADAVVFPSVWDEPFGLVPLEAMACDTPVVGTGKGGSGEYLRDGVNCVLYEAGDDAALAAAVTRLAADPAARTALVREGRGTAASFTADGLADALEDWHLAAVEGMTRRLPADRRVGVGHDRVGG